MGDLDRAMAAYENALRQNPYSIPAMNSISCILRTKEQFSKAVEYLQSILNLDGNNGDIWGSLGHCYLMMDDLQKAYSAYQQALYHLRDPKVIIFTSYLQLRSNILTPFSRNRNFGTELEFCTIAMGLLNMLKRHSHK